VTSSWFFLTTLNHNNSWSPWRPYEQLWPCSSNSISFHNAV